MAILERRDVRVALSSKVDTALQGTILGVKTVPLASARARL